MTTSAQSDGANTFNNTSGESFSAEKYFATQPPPPSLEQDVARVKDFLQKQLQERRKVVLVTSGGTTVPLELNVVRFLDNFSAGTRGATSAEYFLKAGYAVIFMHRQFSLQPFSRHYSHSTHPFLDFLDINEPSGSSAPSFGDIAVRPEERAQLLEVLSTYKAVQRAGTLLTLTFVTVNDYLWLLRAVSQEMSLLGRNCLYYLAAAVSDFFLPRQKMSVHKIQSGKGSLHIEMDQVPKILKPLVAEWTREGFIVSFKLETDEDLLVPKARQALARYGHQVVIGNELHRRKFEVVFVSPKSASPPSASPALSTEIAEPPSADYEETWLTIDLEQNPEKEIEEDIVAELVRRHARWIDNATRNV
ncbi:phosphopantothenate-cysteine ligase [Dichomitus squalens]|uniref:Phosphopantothenate-cysteine ligase n=2 Tax=Dichomitus squalens TaxID=114155 RepID=A0A4Q9NYT9_9APHY|nr:phosphopantothenate-cysteine ligase [Dichomitus squalens LYAD-421 SS1]EJF59785.1 phosphopantothenate-cysteine ligase [Dichomitus squalens LYAD-421 SS1]TBU46728.1 phosphopantothenate-cysteine ligase [Dichomitus squalens]TBU57479.1 phosphopantothenate-cysteine ligase [Dichomitus squalens]